MMIYNIIAIYNKNSQVALKGFGSFMNKTNLHMDKKALSSQYHKHSDGKRLENKLSYRISLK